MQMLLRTTTFLFMFLWLAGCETLESFLEAPKVSLTNVEVLPMQGLQPRFALYLNIENPNPISIPLSALAYQISLDGYNLFNGSTSELPSIPAGGESPLRLELSLNLLESASVVANMLRGSQPTMDYAIDSQVTVSGISRPFHVSETGVVELSN